MIPLHLPLLTWREIFSLPRENYVQKLEEVLCRHFQKKQAIFTGDGRNALYLALRQLGLGAEDEVLIPAYACPALRRAVELVARPVYVDIMPGTFNIGAKEVEQRLTPRSRALVVAHIYGRPCPMGELLSLARARNLVVIEDIAQALGGKYRGQPLGSFGDFTVLSFRFTKDMTCFRGGALLGRESVEAPSHPSSSYASLPQLLAVRLALGQIKRVPAPLYCRLRQKFLVPLFKRNAAQLHRSERALSNYQCFLLYRQLGRLEGAIAKRRANASYLSAELGGLVEGPGDPADGTHSYHRYTVETEKRGELLNYLLAAGIEVDSMYDEVLSPAGLCPESEQAARRCLNLPVHHRLSSPERDRIVQALRRFFQKPHVR